MPRPRNAAEIQKGRIANQDNPGINSFSVRTAAARSGLFVGLRLWLGNFFAGHGFQLSADHVGGKACA